MRPKHVQDWLKRIRKEVHPASLRYFLCGEYGHEGQREFNPHYHVALFGFPSCDFFPGITPVDLYQRSKCTCWPCSTVRDSWKWGKTDVGTLTKDSASYISSYVTKKMTAKTSDVQLEYLRDRHPEFARMSLKPGIGASAMEDVVAALPPGSAAPDVLRSGGRNQPLGRYLKGKLNALLGVSSPVNPKTNREAIAAWLSDPFMHSMLELQKTARANPKIKARSPKGVAVAHNKQKVRNFESKIKITKGKKAL